MADTTSRYWLARAHRAMEDNGYGNLWLPGSTTWRHYMPELANPQRAIRDAQRRGYLTEYTGIPQLTRAGYHAT